LRVNPCCVGLSAVDARLVSGRTSASNGGLAAERATLAALVQRSLVRDAMLGGAPRVAQFELVTHSIAMLANEREIGESTVDAGERLGHGDSLI